MGFGIMSDRDAESIQGGFITLARNFNNILPDAIQWLKCVLQEHYLQCCPTNRDAKQLLKRKKKAQL